MNKCRFQVGDTVRALKDSCGNERYHVTNSKVVCKIVSIPVHFAEHRNCLVVRVLEGFHTGERYRVTPTYFQKAEMYYPETVFMEASF